ncbi:hypothetical protein [Oryza sativa Japonica Group]|uniref:Uncharacterized protein n=2 Tax=Oryza sativa subsp. japonica TaxID=39947 RepID=Q7F298_ORYSJ|nr:hypothetical protein [Oryza sativa Japonica Group]BAB86172.1 OJ1485_B09.1 [Oryza sativa Japonica Group]BAD88367.1 hypothetical protein [Oryza sativa Japonica Group]
MTINRSHVVSFLAGAALPALLLFFLASDRVGEQLAIVSRWGGSSDVSDLAGHGFEKEDYPVVDHESDLQTAMPTTVR